MLRKRFLNRGDIPAAKHASGEEISIPESATIMVTSEMSEHPIDHIFDGHRGPSSTKWVAGEAGDQSVILVFDTPRNLRKVSLEVEETDVERTQELTLAISHDGGKTYREVFRQEYNFSPPGTTSVRSGVCQQWASPIYGCGSDQIKERQWNVAPLLLL